MERFGLDRANQDTDVSGSSRENARCRFFLSPRPGFAKDYAVASTASAIFPQPVFRRPAAMAWMHNRDARWSM